MQPGDHSTGPEMKYFKKKSMPERQGVFERGKHSDGAATEKKGKGAVIAFVVVVTAVMLGLLGYLIYSLYDSSTGAAVEEKSTPPPEGPTPTDVQPTGPSSRRSGNVTPEPQVKEDPYAGVAFPFQMGNNGNTAQVMDHGCWKDDKSSRMMRESNQYGWEWKGCIWQAAKQNRNMCGMQAGGECWIPIDGLMIPKTAIDRSHFKLDKPGECGPGGASYSMHVYSWDDNAKKIIANGDNPGV